MVITISNTWYTLVFQAIRLVHYLWLVDRVHLPLVDNLRSETVAGINCRFGIVTSEEEILQMLTSLECAVLSPSFYLQIQLLSSVSVNNGF